MTLIIENVREEFLPAYKELAKSTQAKLKTKKSQEDLAQQWHKQAQEAIKDYKQGKIKSYKSAKAMHEDILK